MRAGGISVISLAAALMVSGCVNAPSNTGAIDVYTRSIRAASAEAGTSVSLLPPFREGMAKRDVGSVLTRSGYRLINTGVVAPQPGQPSLGVWQKDLPVNGGAGAPCTARYGITVHFDADERLMAAEGHWADGGCG